MLGGPTATGKTALSVALAQAFHGEVISADSMQLYRGLDVGTAKVSREEMQGVPHHMLDILSPEQSFSVADFVAQADGLIRQISQRGGLPLVAGGTGLYLSSLQNGVQFTPQKPQPQLRRQLEQELAQKGAEQLYQELCRIDPEAAEGIHPNNHHRVIRALEIYRATGLTLSQQKARSLPQEPPYDALLFYLDFPQREQLYRRINSRVEQMMERGLLEEARMVYQERERYKTAAQAIGYKELFPYFEKTAPLEECVERLKQASRNYAKRQQTWFRRMPDAVWLDASAPDVIKTAEAQVVRRWPELA